MALLFGYKYRVVILKYCGVEKYGSNETIFADTPEGRMHLRDYLARLEFNVSFKKAQVVSFRSRHMYAEILDEYMNMQK